MAIVSLTFCGQLGVDELEGAFLGNSFFIIFVLVNIFGLPTACDTLFPQLYGGKEPKKMGIVLQKALIVGFVAMFFSRALVMNCKRLMSLYVEKPSVVE
jgi:MATE family multidrug resistance protein